MTTPPSLYQLAVAGVQRLVPYVPGKPIEELQRELGLDRVIKLASNENPLGPSKKALAAMQKVLPELALYPDGSGFNLKNALAKKFSVEPTQITLGNGSNEILELVARAFLAPGLNAVFSQHAFAVYPIVVQAAGAKSVVAPAVNYGHDLQAFRESVNAETRVVFIANPNNPTGTLLSQSHLENFIKSLPVTCVCVIDEAYYEFVRRKDEQETIDWLGQCPNLIIARTFSKAYGLAGLRIGYCFSSPEMADILNRVRQPFNNNSLALAAAEAALDDGEHLQNTIKNNTLGMKQLTEGFSNLGLNWIPSAGNFVSVDLSEPAYPVYEGLLRKGVIVRPVANYDMPNHLRISIGTPEENNLFLQALTDCLNNV
ncbi:histidinol-phosphate transaminase [Methylomicrobium sp. Wu6]|uniref:histidinol-phosphate transaminase n=1 Tax=Methylomicrobium sp. Wu6 TaxID=3107928 RepID=UPI002DD6A202|nr:histidinol-phosphate transaminase [Methylomicrobium sp. Wu6]MEC4747875.1 histidinol-phosphate transaminase [Methylomicrobium sp. Wu6]